MKKSLFKLLLILATILLYVEYSPKAHASNIFTEGENIFGLEGEWTHLNGPYGASAEKIVIDSNNFLYMMCDKGLYKSVNNGESWSFINGDVSDAWAALTLVNDQTLLVGSFGKIFRSTDCGNTWDTLLCTSSNTWISGIKTFGDDMIFASSLEYGTGIGGVYKSVDGGNSWQFISINLAYSIEIDNQGILYLGTITNMFKSIDFGETWEPLLNSSEKIIAISADDSGGVVAVSEEDYDPGKIFMSKNYGRTWKRSPLRKNYKDVIYDFSGNILTCTGDGELIKFDADLENWTLDFKTYAPILCIAENSNYDLFVGAGSSFGIYRRLHNNPSWEYVNDSLPYLEIRTIGQFSTGEIIVGTNGGAQISEDEGKTWYQYSEKLGRTNIVSMTITPDDYVFVGTSATGGGGIYKRHVYDTTWTESHPPYDLVRALANDNQGVLYAGSQMGVKKSVDNGVTWEEANNGLSHWHVYDFECEPNGNVYAATNGGIYISDNHGESWNMFGLHEKDVSLVRIFDNYFYAVVEGELYRKALDNSDWILINNGLTQFYALYLEIDDKNTLYLSTAPCKVFYSDDYGDSWHDLQLDITSNIKYIKFLNPSVFFGSEFDGIFKFCRNPDLFNVFAYVKPPNTGTVSGTGCYNKGETVVLLAQANEGYVFFNWTENGQIISTQENYTFIINDNRYLHANFKPATGIDNSLLISADVYPNPFNDKISIKISEVNPQNVEIQLINSLGQTVYSKNRKVTDNEIIVNTQSLPAGIYICRVLLNNKPISSNKIIKTK